MSERMPWPKKDATQYHAQLGLSHTGRAIKGLVVCNDRIIVKLSILYYYLMID